MSGGALAVVAARLNSSRLPGKQLLDLAGKPLIERIFERLERVPSLTQAVLATTADPYNQPLVSWARTAGRAWVAFAGAVDDLVGRIDAVVQARDPAWICYVCGDSPLIEPATIDRLLRALAADPQADVAALEPPPAGREYIHEGVLVLSRQGWQRLVALSRSPAEREHVGVVLRGRGDLHYAWAAEAALFWRYNHRISVDTAADYRFMAEIYRRWYADHPPQSIVSLAWVVAELERDPALVAINAHVRQKGVGERPPQISLVASGERVAPLLPLARALQEVVKADVQLLWSGSGLQPPGLGQLHHRPLGEGERWWEGEADLLLYDLPTPLAPPTRQPHVVALATTPLVALATPAALAEGGEPLAVALQQLLVATGDGPRQALPGVD